LQDGTKSVQLVYKDKKSESIIVLIEARYSNPTKEVITPKEELKIKEEIIVKEEEEEVKIADGPIVIEILNKKLKNYKTSLSKQTLVMVETEKTPISGRRSNRQSKK
jgi:hypothetical protein